MGRRKILVIEDRSELQRLFKEELGDEGYDIKVATTGEEALEIILNRKEKFNLITLDIALPGIDGKEVLTTLRESGCAIPVIIVTGFDEVDDEIKELSDCFLVKSSDIDILKGEVRTILK